MYAEKQKFNNLEKLSPAVDGDYQIPLILGSDTDTTDFIGFNYAKTTRSKQGRGVHFFLDDYQFDRVWQRPYDYVNILSGFDCVLSPDFSLYSDFPVAMQIYNHYRKHWIAAYLQHNGINVIPTICWSDTSSFRWCFDGEPMHSTVAVSSVGTQRYNDDKIAFLRGYNAMMERIAPEKILFFGAVPDECAGNIIKLPSFQDRFKEMKSND